MILDVVSLLIEYIWLFCEELEISCVRTGFQMNRPQFMLSRECSPAAIMINYRKMVWGLIVGRVSRVNTASLKDVVVGSRICSSRHWQPNRHIHTQSTLYRIWLSPGTTYAASKRNQLI